MNNIAGGLKIAGKPDQIWGGPNSVFNKPGYVLGEPFTQPIFTPNTIMQIVISIVFISASLFVILSRRYAPTDRHWAYGALGTILGFWLRGT
jgi:hypothetical protein